MTEDEPGINIVVTEPPGPGASQLLEVETDAGLSVRVGEWRYRDDGTWALRITPSQVATAAAETTHPRYEL